MGIFKPYNSVKIIFIWKIYKQLNKKNININVQFVITQPLGIK